MRTRSSIVRPSRPALRYRSVGIRADRPRSVGRIGPVACPAPMAGSTERFRALVARDEEHIPLDEAAMLIAAHAYPDLDVDAELLAIDELASGCPDDDLDDLVDYLFGECGFSGDRETYHDPRNSFLNDVVRRRRGIPITLAVTAMEVGRRVGVPLLGVGMPGHFLLRYGAVFLDPFDGGRRLTPDDCSELLRGIARPAAELDPRQLDAVGPRAVLARMLANLRSSYVGLGDTEGLAWVSRLRATIPGVGPDELLQLSRILVNLGRFTEAAEALDDLADQRPDEDDARRLQALARLLRARLN